ncbi:MAG TPA: LacI family DNA-binding transcriptional regulator [Sphingomonas sp.]|jgi:LacI family transcriptional regulator|nr:LacI family DNA-binding transcriptional regulator [Sphingomonas sp.]
MAKAQGTQTMAKATRRATIVDVARDAGVSSKTVSRVFNGEPHVRDDVKRRVRAAADALDYHPNMMARALVRQRSHLIGLVYENPSPSYVVDLQKGVLHRLRNERYRLVVIPVPSVADHAGEVIGLLRSAALDGVVLAPPASDNSRILDDLTSAGIRFARIAPTRRIEAGPSNLIDDVTAAREIAEHVIGLGHRDIGIIKGDPTHASAEARLLGYSQALHAAGLPMRLDRIEGGMFTRESGYDAARRLLLRADRPTAILAQNDDMAVGALIAAREIGLSVPDDLSLVGFDDSEVSRIAWPAITTVRQPVFDMAFAAADMVVAALEGEPVAARRDHRHELVIRQSSGPVPARF